MSFVVFPPEINSEMMYSGPGSESLMAAAAAWNQLAEQLSTSGSSVTSVVSGLQGPWQGPSAETMLGAMTPYVNWLHGTSAQASQMGAQATAAANAYETAHAATVPPPMIEANRSLLQQLISTNFYGQNTPAIGATEAHYGEMWAQDAAAMDNYLTAQQTNTESLQEPSHPPKTVNNLGQDQASALQPQSMASPGGDTGGSSAQSMAANPTPTPPDGGAGDAAGGGGALADELTGYASLAGVPVRVAGTIAFSILIRTLVTVATAAGKGAGGAGAAGAAGAAGTEGLMGNIGTFVDEKMDHAVDTLSNRFSTATGQIEAKLGNAASLGPLKVPESWSSTVTRAAPVLPDAPISTAAPPASSGPPIPGGGQFGQALMGAMGGRGIGAIAGKAPKMAPKPQSSGGGRGG